MIQALIISIVIGILTNGIQIFINKARSAKIDELEEDKKKLKIEIGMEIQRSEKIQDEVNNLLNFQSNDITLKRKMDEHAKIITETRSKKNVEEEFSKISNDIHDIFNSN